VAVARIDCEGVRVVSGAIAAFLKVVSEFSDEIQFFANTEMPVNEQLLWETIETESEYRLVAFEFEFEFDPVIAKVGKQFPDNTSTDNLWKLIQTLKTSYAEHCKPSTGP
jgi:hypothetical protein